MRGSRDLLGGIDVGLRDKRIERNGQQQHAQEKCAVRADREAAGGRCSLLPRQQLSIQRKMLLRMLTYSTQQPRTKSAYRLGTTTASGSPAHWMETNFRPSRVQVGRRLGRSGAADTVCSMLQGLSAGSAHWHARCNIYLVG
jgi:hypothetical protein